MRLTGPAIAICSTGLNIKKLLFVAADCHIAKLLQATAAVSLYRQVLLLETDCV